MNLELLKNLAAVRIFEKGSVMVRENDAGSTMYLLLKGGAEVHKSDPGGNALLLGTLSAGSFFGEMSLFLGKSRTATIVAIEDVTALELTRENAFEIFRQEPELVFSVLKTLCTRLDSLNCAFADVSFRAAPAVGAAPTAEAAHEEAMATDLFPAGHGSYNLQLDNHSDLVLLRSYTCPICENSFKTAVAKAGKYVNERTDPDLRVHYKGIEPMHYDVITCPECLYSALVESFSRATAMPESTQQKLADYKAKLRLRHELDRDTQTVFAGYYLALESARACFKSHKLMSAKLYLKLSRLYHDCQDEAMELNAARQSLEDYLWVYQNELLEPEPSQKLCVVIGELYLKLGDTSNAKKFFFSAKTSNGGAAAMKKHADNRILDIQEMEHASKNS